jgi:Tol biopolymer transport system component
MALASGAHVGSYEILSSLGAGGMGEVYRARDRRLDRTVAIKILPEALANDPERIARFEREAKTLAALNHPNIAHLYGLEESDGARALVMELVEGPTLADRIAQGPIPIDEALPIAKQIAEALEAAHEQGIIHRDLKPANIKVRPVATVKVLDFGLAKALDQTASGATNLTNSPTLSIQATQAGMILGTAAYMSPEQARGTAVDKRTDLWAFGCVLYEMLTGLAVFQGATVSDTLAAVLKTEPHWTALPDDTPASIRRLLRRCLAKDRQRRMDSARDAGLEIDEAYMPVEAAENQRGAVTSHPYLLSRITLVVLILLATAGGLGLVAYLRRPAEELQAYRSSIQAPDGTVLGSRSTRALSFALSPNGRHLAFVATTADGRQRLWVRQLDQGTASPFEGVDNVDRPFWSPDSRSVAFFAEHQLRRIEIGAGSVRTICDTPDQQGTFSGGTWNAEGTILFASGGSQIYRVAASGGAPMAVVTADASAGETALSGPLFLPDGHHFLFVGRAAPPAPPSVYVSSIDDSRRTRLFEGAANVEYAQGRLLFVQGTTLVAQPFDASRRTLNGEPAPIADGIRVSPALNFGDFSISATGVLAYQTGQTLSQLTWFDRTGKPTGVVGQRADYNTVNLSPNGTKAAISLRDGAGNMSLWLFDLVRGVPTRFTFGPAQEVAGVWSPDGTQLAFDSVRKGRSYLYRRATNGSPSEDVLEASPIIKFAASWSSDGKFLLYISAGVTPRTGNDIWVLPLFGDRKPYPFLQTPYNEGRANFSPDGRWIAYASNESGSGLDVYVAAFPGAAGKLRVSLAGGDSPRWRRDGREIFYVAPDGKLMAAAVNGQGAVFQVGAVTPLFDLRMRDQRLGTPYDVTADGQHFLVNTETEQTAFAPITLVVNWPGLLKK